MVNNKILFSTFNNFNLCNNYANYNIIIRDDKNNKDKIPKYIKIFVKNPFNNRNVLLKIAKNQKGIYV